MRVFVFLCRVRAPLWRRLPPPPPCAGYLRHHSRLSSAGEWLTSSPPREDQMEDLPTRRARAHPGTGNREPGTPEPSKSRKWQFFEFQFQSFASHRPRVV